MKKNIKKIVWQKTTWIIRKAIGDQIPPPPNRKLFLTFLIQIKKNWSVRSPDPLSF